jgi:large subunit ribosomal protein L6
MSRIGKKPVTIPSGVEVGLSGSVLSFKKGNAQKELDTKELVNVKVENGEIVFTPKGETREDRAFWGTFRSLADNVIIGLIDGYEKKLEINGVGYKAAVQGNKIVLHLGFSHPINHEIPKDIQVAVEKNLITIKGNDKQVVGQVAAEIRSYRPPEPYKGKGVKYLEEHIIRKAGKTAAK